jgi:hypothetical protein
MGPGSRRPFFWRYSLLACAVALLSGCGSAKDSAADAGRAAQPPAAVTTDAEVLAKKLLGSDARVLFSGDLAHNGHRQILMVNPTSPASGDSAAGIGFHRAAVLQQDGAKWDEVLRCDEYLKNPAGFLRGTPRQPVSGWTLQLKPAAGNGRRELLFTPLPEGSETIRVAWNPIVNRYQSFLNTAANTGVTQGSPGGTMEQGFLEEMPIIETPTSELR